MSDPTKSAAQPAAAAVAPPGQTPPPSASPYSYSATYTLDLMADVAGGRSTGSGVSDLLKLSASWDGSQAGHDGLTALVSLEHSFGSGFTSARVGGFQSTTNTQALPGSTRLYEAWVQRDFNSGKAGLKIGLIDLNTTFDVQETAALFLNASHGIGPDISDTGLNGPSIYPATALAADLFWRPNDDWTAQLGVFDGTAGDPVHRSAFVAAKLDGALVIGQVERRWGDRARAEVGVWTYTKRFASLDQTAPGGGPEKVGGDGGIYGLVEGQIRPAAAGSGAGLNGWLRVGVANSDINPVSSYLGGGLVWTGLIKGRDQDAIGVAVARAEFGRGARALGASQHRRIGGAETNLEATWRLAVNTWLSVQPDAQCVLRPYGDAQLPNALVATLRFVVAWGK